ncbi:hypothetical protein A2U01_0087331, partial [Trifolium medium]|nr:hypothetical protein [Trifolium medium]
CSQEQRILAQPALQRGSWLSHTGARKFRTPAGFLRLSLTGARKFWTPAGFLWLSLAHRP